MPTTITETPDFDLTVDGDSVTLTLTEAIPIISSASSSDGTADLYVERISFNTSNGGPTEQGELAWESSSGTLQAALESGVVAPVGESGLIRVRNTSRVTIPKGAALYFTGTVGASGRLEVAKWAGANVTDVDLFMGFAAAQMLNNSNGYAVWFGELSGIDTDGNDEGEVWADGDVLYAIPSGSSYLTRTEPASGDYVVAAAIINAGSGTSGSIMVRPHFHETVTSADITDATHLNTPLAVARRDLDGAIAVSTLAISNGTFDSTTNAAGLTANRDHALPDASGTFVLDTATQTLTNKTLTSPTINGAAISGTISGGATLSGPIAFSSTTRPTSAGTGTPDATSLITLSDADARYPRFFSAVKTANTLRNSTTVLADDPHLVIADVPVGRYKVELSFQTYDNSTGGFAWAIGGTATASTASRARGASVASWGTAVWGAVSTPLAGESVAPWTNATRVPYLIFEMNVTVAGSITFQWAQHTSNAANTTVWEGSFITLTRLN